MFFIAHRGLMDGPDPLLENSVEQIEYALDNGFDAEIDVWWVNGEFKLGHDQPDYDVSESFLENPRLWCHAKNLEAFHMMLRNTKIHCFWHEVDQATLTSEGFIWTYPGIDGLTPLSIAVMPERHEDMPLYSPEGWRLWKCAGVCTDYAKRFKKFWEEK